MAEETQQIDTSKYEGYKDSYDSLSLRLDPTRFLEEVRHMLKGDEWSPAEQAWKNMGHPKLSEEGINQIMFKLKARMSVDKALANIDTDMFKLIVRDFGEEIMDFILFNADKHGIQEKDFDDLYQMLLDNIRIFLTRPIGGRENELLSHQFGYRESVSRRVDGNQPAAVPQQPRPGIFGWFGGR